MNLAVDFSRVLAKTDCAGQLNYSRGLEGIVRGFNLTYVWEATPPRSVDTHYTGTGASRLDHIYIIKKLHIWKRRGNSRRRLHGPPSCSLAPIRRRAPQKVGQGMLEDECLSPGE